MSFIIGMFASQIARESKERSGTQGGGRGRPTTPRPGMYSILFYCNNREQQRLNDINSGFKTGPIAVGIELKIKLNITTNFLQSIS